MNIPGAAATEVDVPPLAAKLNSGGLLVAAATAAPEPGKAPKVKPLAGVLLLAAALGVELLLGGGVIPKLNPPVLGGTGLTAGAADDEPAAALLPAAVGVLLVVTPNEKALGAG